MRRALRCLLYIPTIVGYLFALIAAGLFWPLDAAIRADLSAQEGAEHRRLLAEDDAGVDVDDDQRYS